MLVLALWQDSHDWYRCVQQAVIENAAGHFEAHDTMAASAIDVCYRVAERRITWLIIWRNAMTGIAPLTDNGRAGVVWVGIEKTASGMTVTTFRVGDRVIARWRVRWSGRLTHGHGAIVAAGTCPGNIGVIKTAVRAQLQKMGGIVAVIALCIRRLMKFRFTDGDDIIMALATISKNFLMIDKWENGKALGCVTGLTHITGGQVIRRFWRDKITVSNQVHAVMTTPAI